MYCSKGCQNRDWPLHKGTCKTREFTPRKVEGVILNGPASSVKKIRISDFAAEGWEPCPVPTLLGVPLVAKRIRPYPGKRPTWHPYVPMMVDPHSGLAPRLWSDEIYHNLVGFARTDGVPFTIDMWGELHAYIYYLMDEYRNHNPNIQKLLTPACLARFIVETTSEKAEVITRR